MNKPSKTRKIYMLKLTGRIILFIFAVALSFLKPEEFNVLKGMNFFKEFSLLHFFWIIWIIDMIIQLMPVRAHISIGSQKLFLSRFKPIREKINYESLKNHIVSTTKSAYKVFILWSILTAIISILYVLGIINETIIFLICVFFYVADLICVLMWCPFRLIMKNKCCTTCRIFNWDHLMMFTPFLFVRSFYAITLLVLAFVIWLIWEICIMMYPERFWEITNTALRCEECTDKLCTQYCHKLRK